MIQTYIFWLTKKIKKWINALTEQLKLSNYIIMEML